MPSSGWREKSHPKPRGSLLRAAHEWEIHNRAELLSFGQVRSCPHLHFHPRPSLGYPCLSAKEVAELNTYPLVVLGAIAPLPGHVLCSPGATLSSPIYQGFFRGGRCREWCCFHGGRRCAFATEQEAQHRLVANDTGHVLILEYSGKSPRSPCCARPCMGACWTEAI